MKLTLLDKSNYLKGLLVLISKDKKVSRIESDLIKKVGRILGFDKEFTDEALETLLENEYISQEPPKFSRKEFAFSFLKDAIKLSVSDLDMNKDEFKFLKATAIQNKIDLDWLHNELNNADRDVQKILRNDNLYLEVVNII